MKKISYIFISLMITFNCFGSSSTHETSKKVLNDHTKKNLISILQANDSLYKAFTNYDGANIEKEALVVIQAIGKLHDKNFKNTLDTAKINLNKLSAKNTREQNNESYDLVSKTFIKLLKEYDLDAVYKGYYCPMAKKYWVQSSATTKTNNPYLPKMTSCGSPTD